MSEIVAFQEQTRLLIVAFCKFKYLFPSCFQKMHFFDRRNNKSAKKEPSWLDFN
jgi:hypothetical protein